MSYFRLTKIKSRPTTGWRAAALGAALLGVGATAQAKPLQTGGDNEDNGKSTSSSLGKLTPSVVAKLRANPGEAKQILVRHRLEWCDTTQHYEKTSPEAARLSARAGVCTIQGPPDLPAVRNAAIPTARTPWKTIRVQFHLFAKDDGTQPTATVSDAQGALSQLNLDYAPGRIRFVSTGILTHRSTRFRDPANLDGEITAMKRTFAQVPARQINVFVFEASGVNPQLLGRGTFAWDKDALGANGGFFCDNDAFGFGKRTATHEFGHCLGLWHPFHGVEEVPEDACGGCREHAGRSVAEGDGTGDFCSDTPPTPRNFRCGAPVDNPDTAANEAVDSCTGKPWGTTDFANYMGYADDDCINHFSTQQFGRMHAWVSYKLKNWMVGNGPNDPPIVESTTPTGRVLARAPLIGASFSQPMNRTTVQAALRIVPAVRGTFVWAADSKSFSLRPKAALPTGTVYNVQILGSARSIKNRTLDGNYNGRADSAVLDSVSWSFRTAGAPANDLFKRAQAIVGVRGTLEGRTEEATKEGGEPNHGGDGGGASVWYRWVAPSDGIATITTEGSAFDTLLGAYDGTAVAALTTLAGNDDMGSGTLDSAVRFPVAAGEIVYLAVDGSRNADTGIAPTGRFTLNWLLTPAPPNDLFARATAISGGSGSVRGDNSGAWSENGEPSHAYNSPTSSIWYRWVAPASGLATFDSEGSTFDTVIAVYTGTSVNALSAIASDDDSGSGTLSQVSFPVVAGVSYCIAVNGSGSGVDAPRGPVKLNWSLLGAPSNDLFANAQTFSGAGGSIAGSNLAANIEDGEPLHNYAHHASIWYRFAAPSNGQLTVTTQNSNFDTVLAAYTGQNVGALTKIVENDDVTSGVVWSSVTLQVVAGTTYSFAVDGSSSSDRGAVALNWAFTPAPPNDNFDAPQIIGGASGQVAGTNVGATAEAEETSPLSSFSSAISSVWYRWTAPASGSVTFNTTGSDFDTVLGVYVQTPTGFDWVGADDDGGPQYSSVVTFDAVAGSVYAIVVDSANNFSETKRGNIKLAWTLTAGAGGRLKPPVKPSEPSIHSTALNRRERLRRGHRVPMRAVLQPTALAKP